GPATAVQLPAGTSDGRFCVNTRVTGPPPPPQPPSPIRNNAIAPRAIALMCTPCGKAESAFGFGNEPRTKKSPEPASTSDWLGAANNSRRRPTLPQSFPCSTIGPGGLNFRVRDGIGCGPPGKTAGTFCRP